MPLTALIADDHPLCREVAKLALRSIDADAIVHEVATLREALAIAGSPDMVILDLNLPDSQNFISLIEIRRTFPKAPILILTALEKADTEQAAADLGATGYIAKSSPISAIVSAIQTIVGGGRAFSDRVGPSGSAPPPSHPSARLATLTIGESRILRAMTTGRLNKQIAFDLGLSEMTVKRHIRSILRKLGVVNRTQAILLLLDEAGG